MISNVAKRCFSRVIKSWRIILNSLIAMLYWAVIIKGLDWYLLGFKSMTAHQWLLYVSATSVTIGSWVFSNPKRRWVKISSEILWFSLSEFAIFSTIITNLLWLRSHLTRFLQPNIDLDEEIRMGRIVVLISHGYHIVLFSAMNTVIHSMYIYHLVRGTEKKVAEYIAPIRAIYCGVGITLTMGLTYVMLSLAQADLPKVDLSLVWSLLFLMMMVYKAVRTAAGDLCRGKKSSIMVVHFHFCRVFGLIHLLFTIAYIILVFGIVDMAEQFGSVMGDMTGGRPLPLNEIFPIAYILGCCGFASQQRYQYYLLRKIAASSEMQFKKRR
ncbi:uncharacterized protein LOC119070742 [Bradysia coprophila]|uniref:uncharacterized protein LOC119070742 n=1 Tax=Bradysia coprophila TaxID=38358 RepID=UPI00187DD832|nr:uncharacterized protein LOC119070742 [Bradysia coprophila]